MKNISFQTAAGLSEHIRYVMAGSNVCCAVAFWGKDMDGELQLQKLAEARAKIICDISMGATSDKALVALGAPNNPHVRKMDKLHAKVYISSKGAVIGSANASNNGIGFADFPGRHVEAGVFCKPESSLWKQAKRWFQEVWTDEKLVSQVNMDDIEFCKRVYRPRSRARTKSIRASFQSPVFDLATMSWNQYEGHVRFGRLKTEFASRIEFLSRVGRFVDFAKMDVRARQEICGTIRSAGMFGSMFGSGTFKSVANKHPERFQRALTSIPSDGSSVTKKQYDQFRAKFLDAFNDQSRKGSYPTASRLLAIKRPDTFACINSENIIGISSSLGFAKSTLTLENYWDLIVQPIADCQWYLSQRPKEDLAGKLWDNRAAMLDSLYYVMK